MRTVKWILWATEIAKTRINQKQSDLGRVKDALFVQQKIEFPPLCTSAEENTNNNNLDAGNLLNKMSGATVMMLECVQWMHQWYDPQNSQVTYQVQGLVKTLINLWENDIRLKKDQENMLCVKDLL